MNDEFDCQFDYEIFYCAFCSHTMVDGDGEVLAKNGGVCCSQDCANEINYDASR